MHKIWRVASAALLTALSDGDHAHDHHEAPTSLPPQTLLARTSTASFTSSIAWRISSSF
jgi:hypothetical protein